MASDRSKMTAARGTWLTVRTCAPSSIRFLIFIRAVKSARLRCSHRTLTVTPRSVSLGVIRRKFSSALASGRPDRSTTTSWSHASAASLRKPPTSIGPVTCSTELSGVAGGPFLT